MPIPGGGGPSSHTSSPTKCAQYLNFSFFSGVCGCKEGFEQTGGNLTCLMIQRSLCDPNPCKGGGTCEEHDGTYSCYCPPGLAGSNCEHDVTKTALNIASFTGHSLLGIVTPDDMINRFQIEFSFYYILSFFDWDLLCV